MSKVLQKSVVPKSYAALVMKVADALMAAQVAVYPVDASAITKNDHLASQHTMENMAERTGGRVFKNSNDLILGLKSSVEDGSAYYTLEYYPDNKKWDGQFRTIEIKSSKPGMSLRYREGYYALDPEKVTRKTLRQSVRPSAGRYSLTLPLPLGCSSKHRYYRLLPKMGRSEEHTSELQSR